MKSKYFLWLSISVFVISIFLPVYISDVNTDNSMGYDFLTLGWMSYPSIDFFCWLANFTLLISWIFYNKVKGIVFAYITFILMASYGIDYLFDLDYFGMRGEGLLVGYYFWLASSIILIWNKNDM